MSPSRCGLGAALVCAALVSPACTTENPIDDADRELAVAPEPRPARAPRERTRGPVSPPPESPERPAREGPVAPPAPDPEESRVEARPEPPPEPETAAPAPRERGAAQAERDLALDLYRILETGAPEWWSRRFAEILRHDHGIDVVPPPDPDPEYAEGYASVALPAIRKKFGTRVLEEAAEEARRVEREVYRMELEPQIRPYLDLLASRVSMIESLATNRSQKDQETARGMITELETPDRAYDGSSYLDFVERSIREPAIYLDPAGTGERVFPTDPADFGVDALLSEFEDLRLRLGDLKRALGG